MSLVTITCPSGCEDYLPPFLFSECDPDVDFGQIDRIYLTGNGHGLSDWTDPAEWATRLDNDDPDNDTLIRTLHVAGDQPAAESAETTISLCRIVYGPKSFTLNFDIDETNVTNNDAMRLIECNDLFTIWFAAGKYLYGGTGGIDDVSITMNNVIPRGCETLNLISGTAKWKNKFHPEKIVNPLL